MKQIYFKILLPQNIKASLHINLFLWHLIIGYNAHHTYTIVDRQQPLKLDFDAVNKTRDKLRNIYNLVIKIVFIGLLKTSTASKYATSFLGHTKYVMFFTPIIVKL